MAMIGFLLMVAFGLALSEAGLGMGDWEFWLLAAIAIAYGVVRSIEGRE